MGIFSFLGKKDRRELSPESQIDAPRRRRDDRAPRPDSAINSERAANSQIVQRDAARKTALKIDAIESEMSSELTRPAATPASNSSAKAVPPSTRAARAADQSDAASGTAGGPAKPAETFLTTLPAMGMSTDFLLGAEARQTPGPDLSAPETAPVIEEAAILFANDQNEMVEHMLLGAIDAGDLGHSTDTV
ncbi:MAG: hypothetical protein M3N23_03025, partial [Pseudomonadota bacterium]|nr:hypothetical protein [Pseudomonadota bacterium]